MHGGQILSPLNGTERRIFCAYSGNGSLAGYLDYFSWEPEFQRKEVPFELYEDDSVIEVAIRSDVEHGFSFPAIQPQLDLPVVGLPADAEGDVQMEDESEEHGQGPPPDEHPTKRQRVPNALRHSSRGLKRGRIKWSLNWMRQVETFDTNIILARSQIQ